MPSPLAALTSDRPGVRALDHRAGPPGAQRVLVLVEERLLGAFLASLAGGDSVLTRYFDDLQNEGWEVAAYGYDVRSHETGERYHRHLPADYTPVYQAWQQGQCLGEGVLRLMRQENLAGGPHAYRNIVFGDPTLKLSY